MSIKATPGRPRGILGREFLPAVLETAPESPWPEARLPPLGSRQPSDRHLATRAGVRAPKRLGGRAGPQPPCAPRPVYGFAWAGPRGGKEAARRRGPFVGPRATLVAPREGGAGEGGSRVRGGGASRWAGPRGGSGPRRADCEGPIDRDVLARKLECQCDVVPRKRFERSLWVGGGGLAGVRRTGRLW